jgi:hypothetical protein
MNIRGSRFKFSVFSWGSPLTPALSPKGEHTRVAGKRFGRRFEISRDTGMRPSTVADGRDAARARGAAPPDFLNLRMSRIGK